MACGPDNEIRVYDVVGVNYRNKGAQLMLKAIQERLEHAPFPALLSVNMKLARHSRRHGDKLYASLWLEGSRPGKADALIRGVGALLPLSSKRKYRLVADREVDVILDSSGFLYGDQWGLRGVKRRLASARLWARQKKHLILMPQAFGPFSGNESKTLMAELIELSTLVYARDSESFNYLRDVAPAADNLRLAPDFTGLVSPSVYPEIETYRDWVGIVPNAKMVTMENRDSYFSFLDRVIRRLHEKGEKVFFLIHEKNDLELAQELMDVFGIDLPVHHRDDPKEIKATIGVCRFIVASRFHAIVSALSQGVPVIGTSWSHKYRHLFRDYRVESLLVEGLESESLVVKVIDDLCEPVYRKALQDMLNNQLANQKAQIESMWVEIFTHTSHGRAP